MIRERPVLISVAAFVVVCAFGLAIYFLVNNSNAKTSKRDTQLCELSTAVNPTAQVLKLRKDLACNPALYPLTSTSATPATTGGAPFPSGRSASPSPSASQPSASSAAPPTSGAPSQSTHPATRTTTGSSAPSSSERVPSAPGSPETSSPSSLAPSASPTPSICLLVVCIGRNP